jgi:hypothetical protein
MRKLLAVAAVVVILASGQTRAEETAVIFGSGGTPGRCGSWAAAVGSAVDNIYTAWVMGYLSAASAWAKPNEFIDVTHSMPPVSVLMWRETIAATSRSNK